MVGPFRPDPRARPASERRLAEPGVPPVASAVPGSSGRRPRQSTASGAGHQPVALSPAGASRCPTGRAAPGAPRRRPAPRFAARIRPPWGGDPVGLGTARAWRSSLGSRAPGLTIGYATPAGTSPPLPGRRRGAPGSAGPRRRASVTGAGLQVGLLAAGAATGHRRASRAHPENPEAKPLHPLDSGRHESWPSGHGKLAVSW